MARGRAILAKASNSLLNTKDAQELAKFHTYLQEFTQRNPLPLPDNTPITWNQPDIIQALQNEKGPMSRENTHFTPTPFDWRNYTNSTTAHKANITNLPSNAEQKNLQEVHKAVQEIEKLLRRNIEISSGFRNKDLNDKIPNASSSSSHISGYAADLIIPKEEHRKVILWLKENMTESKTGSGLPILNQVISYEDTGHLHIDVDPNGRAKLGSRRYSKKVIVGTKIVNGEEKNITELQDY